MSWPSTRELLLGSLEVQVANGRSNGDKAPAGKDIQWFDASDVRALDSWPTKVAGGGNSSSIGNDATSTSSGPTSDDTATASDGSSTLSSLAGTYASSYGDQLVFAVENDDLVQQTDDGGALHLRLGSDGIYHGVEATVGFHFDTGASPVQVHMLTDGDTVYTKVS